MQTWLDTFWIFIALTNLILVSSVRLTFMIRLVAVQGFLIGSLPFFIGSEAYGMRALALALTACTLKGFVFPFFLRRALKNLKSGGEAKFFIPHAFSILFGVLILGLSVRIASKLPLLGPMPSEFAVPVSFAMVLTGLFVIATRARALSQVLGFLVLENGIYAMSSALFVSQPAMVELGMLLDVFVAVFVMGIAVFHISREFDHIDTSRLTSLSDWNPEGEEKNL